MNFRKWTCLLLAFLCLTLTACQEEVPISTDPIYTWDSIPQLTFGVLESDPLEVLPWYSGRTEISSNNKMAETELGFYLTYDFSNLIYADKVNLNNWVYLCGQPDCKHGYAVGCHSAVDEEWAFLKNGRLYFSEMTGFSPHLYKTMGAGNIFVSTLPDGTDKRLEYVCEESLLFTGGRTKSEKIGDRWIKALSSVDEQGNEYDKFFIVDDRGGREIQGPGTYGNNSSLYTAYTLCRLRGEPLILFGSYDAPGVYRLVEDSFVPVNVTQDDLWNGYLSGDILRFSRKGDGYYDYNTVTGEKVKISDTYFDQGYGNILTPNCILEYEQREKIRHMALFDGQTWREVALPPEISGDETKVPSILALTSDSILLTVRNPDIISNEYVPPTYDLYRIPLGEESLRLEYCGKIHPSTG